MRRWRPIVAVVCVLGGIVWATAASNAANENAQRRDASRTASATKACTVSIKAAETAAASTDTAVAALAQQVSVADVQQNSAAIAAAVNTVAVAAQPAAAPLADCLNSTAAEACKHSARALTAVIAGQHDEATTLDSLGRAAHVKNAAAATSLLNTLSTQRANVLTLAGTVDDGACTQAAAS